MTHENLRLWTRPVTFPTNIELHQGQYQYLNFNRFKDQKIFMFSKSQHICTDLCSTLKAETKQAKKPLLG
ncbi:hypothetical protein K443DRAFT_5685 [Laccaria amethystina LaAM-08-1]|uniref:Uncharacterized protein n=1 Tax=Laccaria amethystina LaAM-08-1 TaxID=1095629 RepID=A0A0C9WUM0_9AGAR|nr:hypothetical protein K443DRAFT_5685 [Laccaria amethystina LaAM-08-1]